MRSRPGLLFVLALLVFTLGGRPLHAAVASRLAGAISDTSSVSLQGHIHPQVKRAADNGRLNGETQLSSLSLNFGPSAAQATALDALLKAQQDPSSPHYHQWLSPAQFGEQFGMSADDLVKVTAWLQSRGFTVERVAPSRNAIHFSGTADQVERSFHTELHSLTIDGEARFANTTEPSVPAALAGAVVGIGGLNNFRLKAHVRASAKVVPYAVGARSSAGLAPAATDGGTPPSEYVVPEDFAKIYDVAALYNAGYNGSASYPIAIIGQSAVLTADLTAFRTAFGLSTSNMPTMVLEPGTGAAVTNTDDLSESELDLEWSGAVAPSAPVYFIYTGSTSANGVFDALQYAIQTYTVSGNPIPIISLSYGSCEAGDTTSDYAKYESWFKQANAQGQTILNSSGDQGAAGCDYTTVSANSYAATQGLAVSYPASSQYVTGVGGTSFTGDLTSNSTYWAINNDNNYGNENGLYIPSGSWNDTPTAATALQQTGLSASGGGVSALWPKPFWQTGVAGIPADGKRDVPDIALSADPDHDGFLVCINSSCAGSNGYFNVYGGTSVAAPSFAGILALTEQKLGAAQGNLNPAIYTLASNSAKYASAFHDITTGSNIVPCVVAAADTGCTNGTMGYNATTGYDLVTGLGAPDAANFASALAGVVPLIATTNTLTYAPSAPTTGQTVTFAASIGTASLTTPPTGAVVFTVDGAATGTSVSLSASANATFAATFATGGPHTVTAVYSGDGNYYGSSATANVTVTIATVPPPTATATTLSLNNSTVALGGSLTLTANVSSTATGTLIGTVTFSSGSGSLGTANVAANGATATAVLTITVATATLPVGADSITATFNGGGTPASGGIYNASASTASSITVTNPTVSLSAPNISIASGALGTSTVTITSAGGYAGTLNLTATATSQVLLRDASVLFNPAPVTLSQNGTATSTFTISTNSAIPALKGGGRLRNSSLSLLAAGGGVSLAGLLLFGWLPRRKRLPSILLSLLAFAVLGSAIGCGSSSSSTGPGSGGGGGGGGGSTGTNVPAGTYIVTLVATDSVNGSITNSVNVTVTLH